MNFIKEYIIQSIVCASNNLRLSTEKIEIVTLIKQSIEKEEDISLFIYLMKQKTEFSKLAVKLDSLHKYISIDKTDFLKVSEIFKEHCHFITQELGLLLDILSTSSTKKLLEELSISKQTFLKPGKKEVVDLDSSKKNAAGKNDEKLLEDKNDKEEFNFEDFEKKILKPIRKFDEILNKLPALNYTEKAINEVADLVKLNADLATNVGFDIIGEMHHTFFKALKLIQNRKIPATKETVESMRACLIVIVAVVRRKDVDISKYLKKAEIFGRSLIKNTKELS